MSAGAKITVYSVLCLIWGSTWLMIKVGLGDAPPLTTAGLRFLLAALVILVILLQQRIALPRSRAFFLLASYLGIFHMAVPYGLVYWAEQHLTAGLTAVVFATMPLMVTVLARLFLGDPLSPWKTAGILMGAVGVYVIFSDSVSLGGRESVYGVLAVLASAFFAGLSSIVAKKYSTDYPPFAT
ncbi:MAG: DMT family transporter, partial [Candidatus Krumholzibacteria bacterium]|nr:DMT family transporter [Candidatus Krumholzibacteria bacterium]